MVLHLTQPFAQGSTRLKPEILPSGFTHVVIFAFCCELVNAGDWISLTGEDIVFLATVVGTVSFHMLPLDGKDGKDAGFCTRCVTGWLGPRCRQFLHEGKEFCNALLQVGPFANKESSKQFCFHLKGTREGARYFVFFHTQSSNGWPAGCSVGQASNICAERQAHVARQ